MFLVKAVVCSPTFNLLMEIVQCNMFSFTSLQSIVSKAALMDFTGS